LPAEFFHVMPGRAGRQWFASPELFDQGRESYSQEDKEQQDKQRFAPLGRGKLTQGWNGQELEQVEQKIDNQPGQNYGQVELDITVYKLLAGIMPPENDLVAFSSGRPQNSQVEEKKRQAAEINQGGHMSVKGKKGQVVFAVQQVHVYGKEKDCQD